MWAGGAALALHVLIMLWLPDVPAERAAESPTPLVWMTPTADEPASVSPVDARSGASSAAHAQGAARRRRAPAARPSLATNAVAASNGAREHADAASEAGTGEASAESSGDTRAGTGDPLAQLVRLARRARLLSVSAPCRGYFPAHVSANHGVVRLQVQVDASGRTRSSRVLDQDARAREFAAAASACAAALQFAPALDTRGVAVASDAKLELRFDRS